MGFMDKVKAQATVLAEKAQEGAKAGQGKLESMQAKRHSDALLLELGGIVYTTRMGRGGAGADARIEALVARLRDFEAQHGEVRVTPADGTPGDTGSFVPSGAGSGDDDAEAEGEASGASAAAAPAAAAPGGGIPTATSGGGIPTATSGGGIPAASPGGGIPAASYSSEDDEAES